VKLLSETVIPSLANRPDALSMTSPSFIVVKTFKSFSMRASEYLELVRMVDPKDVAALDEGFKRQVSTFNIAYDFQFFPSKFDF
jgi:hypothetical protein